MNAAGREPGPGDAHKATPVILIVEDEMLLRMAMADQLRSAGYAVIETANAEQAIEVLRRGEQIKLIISDIHMPGAIDGAELARRVRAQSPQIKILLTSGQYVPAGRVPHDGYFRKPYDIEKMIRHIEALLA